MVRYDSVRCVQHTLDMLCDCVTDAIRVRGWDNFDTLFHKTHTHTHTHTYEAVCILLASELYFWIQKASGGFRWLQVGSDSDSDSDSDSN